MLLTRSPLSPGPKPRFSLDLHVLGAPPAFVLSQDQTLREETDCPTEAETNWCLPFELATDVSEGVSSKGVSPHPTGKVERGLTG